MVVKHEDHKVVCGDRMFPSIVVAERGSTGVLRDRRQEA